MNYSKTAYKRNILPSMKTIFIFFIGSLIGWLSAHKTIATECERLGNFYVGNKTYHCFIISNKKGA